MIRLEKTRDTRLVKEIIKNNNFGGGGGTTPTKLRSLKRQKMDRTPFANFSREMD